MSNGNDTPKKSSKRGSKTGSSTMRQSGLIYLPSTVGSLEEWLTLLRQDSRASPIASQGNSEGLTMNGTSGLTRSELSVRWDPESSSWRTYPDLFSLAKDGKPMGEPYLGSLPKQGMCADGQLWGLTMWAHPTVETDGGVSGWPTPSTMDHIERQGMRPSRAATNRKTGYLSEAIVQQGEKNWPTSQPGPLAQETQTHGSELYENDPTLPQPSPKRLNPSFVEWIMGVPTGWTSLKPLATESYQQWWQSFSGG
jgi:hypothetical protein